MGGRSGYSAPKWLLAVLLVAAGAGAAAGPVLASRLVGNASITVSQALSYGTLLIGDNTTPFSGLPGSILVAPPAGARAYVSVSDNQTQFTASVDMLPTGARYDMAVPITNRSNNPMRAQLILDIPEILMVDVEPIGVLAYAPGTSGLLRVGRTSSNTWEFTAPAGIVGTDGTNRLLNGLVVHVALPSSAPPGFYTIRARIDALN